MRRVALLAVIALLAAACGDSAGDGTPAVTEATAAATTTAATTSTTTTAATTSTTTTAATSSTTTAAAVASGPCPDEPFTGTIERSVAAETSGGTHAAISRSDGELVSAYAFDFGIGGTYTVYVGDHQIDEGGVGSDTLVAPPGGLLATIFLQSEDPLTAGSVVGFNFVPIVDTGGGAEVTGFGADDLTGEAVIIGVTDDVICFDIDTSDPQQEIDGIVSARIAG